MSKAFQLLFGCWHKNYSFPITLNKRMYVTCLKCGKEMGYDWEKMKKVA